MINNKKIHTFNTLYNNISINAVDNLYIKDFNIISDQVIAVYYRTLLKKTNKFKTRLKKEYIKKVN